MDRAASAEFFAINEKIKKILESDGYHGVIPPTLDFPETFQEYESFDAFQVRDSLGEDLYLRNDVTAQIIKGFTNFLEYSEESEKEFKFYYMLPVFRDARKSYPRLREIYQMGAENLGIEPEKAIPMLIKLSSKIVNEILNVPVTMILGDIRIYNYLSMSINNPEIKNMIQDRDVPSLSGVFQEQGWGANDANKIWSLLLYVSTYEEWLNSWRDLKKSLNNSLQAAFMDDVERLVIPGAKAVDFLQKENINISWEPLVVRKVDYYTGFIFEGFVEGQSSSPLRGGTYDNLVGKYSNRDMTASGFALDISAFLL
jgi:ATP phosphoribosyltransferase regulatory subunit